jgi:uncharacterized damage-inducible protein DinB
MAPKISGESVMQASLQSASRSEALAQELEDYRLQFLAVSDDASELLASLSEEQFNWSPRPGVWSVAQCIDHLNVTGRIYGAAIDEKIAEGRAQQRFSKGPFRHKWLDKLFVRTLEPPVKQRFKAPGQFAPQADQPLDRVSAEFMQVQEQFLERLQNANGLDLRRIKVTSPITRLLKMTLLGVFWMVVAHERRHLWQARQLLRHENFPQNRDNVS